MKDENGEDKKVTIYYHDKAGNEFTKEVKKYGFSADAEGKNEDTWTLRMSWVAARAMAVVFGAQARNDTAAQGYDPMTKMHYAEIYRDKMMNKNADEHGNKYTIHQFKTFAMDFFNATVTESFENVQDSNGEINIKKTNMGIR